MRKIHWIILFSTLSILILIGSLYLYNLYNVPVLSKEEILKLSEEANEQRENITRQTIFEPFEFKIPNKNKNVYFGDLHVHSSLSFDAYIFGNRYGLEDTYKFAKGEPMLNMFGEKMQISRPLDFTAVTDHAETFGLQESCADPEITQESRTTCERLESPSYRFFFSLRETSVARPPVSIMSEAIGDKAKEERFVKSTWDKIIKAADHHNEPGVFTTFVAYEYSPTLPDGGYNHRNVIFKNNIVPEKAYSLFDAHTAIDLWKKLLAGCNHPCEFMTIPHNGNRSWGYAFANHTIDNEQYTLDDWKLRNDNEPLVEIFQDKGNSECSTFFGSTDEECNIEQFYPKCKSDDDTLCIQNTSMARDGLKKGLVLDGELGFNPLDFGLIGSSDSHNSNPGDTEEWDYRGRTSFVGPSKRRVKDGILLTQLVNNPGGLAAIWAEENNRDALFEAMQKKEVYATSGTRIKLRFFLNFEVTETLLESVDPIAESYKNGYTMGSTVINSSRQTPKFYISAKRDSLSAPLDKIQIIKGWTENGKVKEVVYDVICSDERVINSKKNKCKPTKAKVDFENCSYNDNYGADEFEVIWTDDKYSAEQNTFYYARVIENPTCRWSTYDSIRIDEKPAKNYPKITREMAWSSPIWIKNK